MNNQPYHLYSAQQLSQGLAAGQWSSEDLTSHFLERISELNPDLHAIHTLNPQALKQARQIDKRREQGEKLSPLAGLPMTLKDAFACSGLTTTYGLALYANHRSKHDSRVIAALKEAGVIFLGRSAVPTASFDWNCRNQVFPECVNPLAPAHTPGGSSGGAAAALSAKLTPLELGSDVAGSIRYPAHCCGVYGLRTTDGWLPFSDIGPNPAQGFHTLSVCGPMARDLDDLTLLTDLFSQRFPDSRLRPVQKERSAASLKMAFSFGIGGLAPDTETKQLMEQWLGKLRQQGVQLVEAQPQLDFAALNTVWGHIVGYEMTHTLPSILPKGLKQLIMNQMLFKRLGSSGWMRPALLQGMGLSKSGYQEVLERHKVIQQQTDAFFEEFDAWVLPVSPTTAIKRENCGQVLDTHLGKIPYTDFLSSYLCPTTVMGTPALSIPMGLASNGLPVGLQVHGARFGDLDLVALVQSLEGKITQVQELGQDKP